ncbi:transcription termination factor Rho [Patescibacteria group bacterium]|nr:transcription termination factor Rho [Patescibacteria group bacterium]
MPVRKTTSKSSSNSSRHSRNSSSTSARAKSTDNDSSINMSINDNGNNHRSTSQNDGVGYYSGDTIPIEGILQVLTDYGVIRQEEKSEDDLPKDVYISHSQIRRFNLRMGDIITGQARPPKEGERYLSLLKIESVSGRDPEEAKKRPKFEHLTAVFPDKWMKLETEPDVVSTRLIDLASPIGKGQRAMIVAPPKAGKTWLLKDIANGLTTNYPEVVLLVALIGERPEEVTHFSRSVEGQVFASNFDERAEDQTRVAELCLARAKRLAEEGKDVVILMDSITRLARAYNMVAPPSGRTLTGGFDPAALYPAKHFFGAARNLEEGGSLTIIGTALVDTGSRMDDVIFEEFKGTGNMELKLDRTLANRRIFPTIDIKNSSTRHEERLYDADDLESVFKFRRMIDLLDDKEVAELVINRLRKSKDNKEFLKNLHKAE